MKTKIIKTECGEIKGLDFEDYLEFRGIKYASANRWEYPVITEKWDGVYDATQFGACCFQRRAFEDDAVCNAFYHREFREGLTFTYSEDCLFLNIQAPADGEKHPVAVFIHGGTFTGGSANEKHINGSEFAKRGIVYVSINYRLGPYGFCSHPDLRDENGLVGNYGLYDQAAALQWVTDNIPAFGGDPQNVTIMGQSAGAISADIQISADMNKGRFSGCFLMSSAAMQRLLLKPMTPERTVPYWEMVMKNAGVTTMAELKKTDAKLLFYAWLKAYGSTALSMPYTFPVYDGKILKKENFNLKSIPGIAYLIGMCSLDMIPPVLAFADRKWAKAAEDRCFTYVFDHDLPGDDNRNWHCADMPYVFGTLSSGWRPYTDTDRRISDGMLNAVTAFIKTQNPNCPAVPQWNADRKKSMIFCADTHFGKRPVGKFLANAFRQGPKA